jgi:hypothetical protein
VYEGWERNDDGTYNLVFGYLNRNYEEELYIPIGPDNLIEPGGDRGQPTRFIPRALQTVFKVSVPSDWGSKEVVWTLTAHGHTEKAYGTLARNREFSAEMHSGRPNQSPEIAVDQSSRSAAVGQPLTVMLGVRDDGVPEPRPARDNVPARGLQIIWIPYRGPGTVSFAPMRAMVTDGKAATQITFTVPGSYELRVLADDGQLTSHADIKVTVAPAATATAR